jgi:hypothetical protein
MAFKGPTLGNAATRVAAAELVGMDRTAWINEFTDELHKLRPHLKPGFGTSKVSEAIALQAYDGKLDPKVAAQR